MKRLLAIVISMAMIVAMMPAGVFAADDPVAKIGDIGYATLAEAVAAVHEKTGEDRNETYTIELQGNASGGGIPVGYSSIENATTKGNNPVNIVIDLNGYTYTVTNPTVGSAGTETNGFQMLKGSSVTFKDGTISTELSGGILLQNYCNLTLDNVTVSAQNENYVMSNNYGNILVKGNTNIVAGNDNVAFDLWYGLDGQGLYDDGVKVTFDSSFNGTVKGKIEYGAKSAGATRHSDWRTKTVLNINGNGTFEGSFASSSDGALSGAKIAITGGTFSDLNVLDYLGDNANVAIKLAENETKDVVIPASKTVTLDLNGKTLTNSSNHTITNNGTLTVTGAGTVDNITNGKGALYNKGTATLESGTFTRSQETGASKTDGGGNSWYTIKNVGTMTIEKDVTVSNSGHFSSMMSNGYFNNDDYTNNKGIEAPTLTIKGGTFTGGINTIKNDDRGVLYINGGTFTNKTQAALQNHGTATVTDGIFEAGTGNFYSIDNCGCDASIDPGKLTVSGGTFKGIVNIRSQHSDVKISGGAFTGSISKAADGSGNLSITGGTFSKSPQAYVADGKVYKYSDSSYAVANSAPSGYYWTAASTDAEESEYDFVGTKISYYGGGSSSTTPTTTDEVTNTTEEKKTDTSAGTETTTVEKTTATVKNTTTTAADGTKTIAATVSTATAEKIVENAVSNKSEEVVVNTTAAAVTETAAGTTTKVDLPEQTVKAIAEQTEAAVTIKTEAAEVTLDKESVKAVAEQAGDTGTVNLVVETVKQDENAVQVDLKLVTSKGIVSDFRGGNVSVTVKLNAKLAAREVKCVYIDDNDRYHKVDGAKNADGTFTFKTGHFSTYAIMAADEADKAIADQNAKINTLIKELKLTVRTSKTSKKSIKAVVSGDVKAITDAGYTVKYKFYRSAKKASKYTGKTEIRDAVKYVNTAGKKGTRYYYKAVAYVYDGDTLVGQTKLTQCKYGCRTWSK